MLSDCKNEASINLAGKICVIAGGTGFVGEEIVRFFLKAGAIVVVPSRSSKKLAYLKTAVGTAIAPDHLSLLEAKLDDASDARRLRDEIVKLHGPPHAVIASLGGSWEERLSIIDTPIETYRRYQENNLNAHIITAQTFLPLLAQHEGTSYTLLGGLSAVLPIERYSPVAITSAALLMLVKTLIAEMRGTSVRINELLFGIINTRANAYRAKSEWITAREVAEVIAHVTSDAGRMISGSILQFGDRPCREKT